MAETLAGTWKMESVENLDEFLKEMGQIKLFIKSKSRIIGLLQ